MKESRFIYFQKILLQARSKQKSFGKSSFSNARIYIFPA